MMLLTTHVGGLGLNLTAADTVIFLEHDYNPMKDLQVRTQDAGRSASSGVLKVIALLELLWHSSQLVAA